MEEFEKYLQRKGLVKRNQKRMVNLLTTWLNWLPIAVEKSSYKDLMDYIGYLQKGGKAAHHINRALQTISHYYEFKKLENVALSTRVKGMIKKALAPPLKGAALEELYEVFESTRKNYFKYSDGIILGLMIYQGLEMGDFMTLELKDIDLRKGRIYVAGRGRRNSRTLILEASQILALHIYILQHRSADSEKLFSPQADDYHQLHWQFKQLSRAVKKQGREKLDLQIQKLSQLRQSRIAIWVKEQGLRKAQYLAGFKRVLSAERYRKEDLSDLKDQIDLHHPLK